MMAARKGFVLRAVRSAVFVLKLALLATFLPSSTSAAAGDPAPARQRELVALLKNDCGACHGMRLAGGLGPALTPDALKDKPAEALAATILAGRAGTAMPPWRRFLSDADAEWLAARLVEGSIGANR